MEFRQKNGFLSLKMRFLRTKKPTIIIKIMIKGEAQSARALVEANTMFLGSTPRFMTCVTLMTAPLGA